VTDAADLSAATTQDERHEVRGVGDVGYLDDEPDTELGPDPRLTPLLREMRSHRTFVDDPVSDDDLALLLEAARWAPSTWNTQPWRFVVVRRATRDTFGAVVASLSESNQRWAADAPVLVVVAATPLLDDGRPNRHALHDVGIASAFMAVQAVALGLHVQSMAGFHPEVARAAVGVPADHDVITVLAIGRVATADVVAPDSEQRQAQRTRRSVREIARDGAWDRPYGTRTGSQPRDAT